MKRFLAWLLLAATVLSMCSCAAAPAQPESTEAPAEQPAAETVAAETQTTAAETEPEILSDSLFVKVSAITFSVVGETDDIYLGLVPREQVTWESEDPSIVSVDNGVLTATGVGTTTIRATYYDRQVEITAGCLAETQEELESLDYKVLCTPKRLPPEVDLEEPCTYFDNAALVGDSISYFLMQWESKTNYLGNILFLARGGISMNGLVQRFKNVYYRGKEVILEEAIAESGVERVYFLMGSNDLASTTQRPYLYDNWDILLDRIWALSPDVEIVLMTNIPLYDETPRSSTDNSAVKEHNDRVAAYNIRLKEIAEERGCLFLDLGYYVQDHCNKMPEIYNQGSYHMNELGCLNWMKILRYYAQYELEGGSLS